MSRKPILPRLIQRLRRDQSGAAAVEFALWGVLFFGVIIVSLDFGFYLAYTGRVASASEQAAVIAYNKRASGPVSASDLSRFIAYSADVPGDPVRTPVTCNGSTQACAAQPAARSCACVSGMAPTYTPEVCGAVCPSGATAGYYVTLASEYDFKAVVSPHPFLQGKVIRQSATVRLQ